MLNYGKVQDTGSILFQTSTDGVTYPKKQQIAWLSLCNTSGSQVTVNIYLVKDGDSASDNNIIINDLEIQQSDSFTLTYERILLENGDFIWQDQSTDDVITFNVSQLNYLEV